MTSLDCHYKLRSRKNPRPACQPITEHLAGHRRQTSEKTKCTLKDDAKPHASLSPSKEEKKTRGQKKKPVNQENGADSVSPSCSPSPMTANGRLSLRRKGSEPAVPHETTVCLPKVPKRSQRGRKKTQVPTEDTNVSAIREPSDKLDSYPTAINCADSAETDKTPSKAKVRSVRCSKRALQAQILTESSATPHTLCPVPQQDIPVLPNGAHLDSGPSTPKNTRHQQPVAALSSTPLCTVCLSQEPVNTAKTTGPQCCARNGHQEELELSPIKGSPSDVPPKKRGRSRKPKAPDKPTAQPKKKKEREARDAPLITHQRKRGRPKAQPQNQQAQRVRPRFELHESKLNESKLSDQDVSSDLSIELSLQEKSETTNHSLSLQEDEEEDEEELPSFLQQTNLKPSSIREGLFVWFKLRKYPFWPAMVKSVNHKNKKASVVFIDGLLFNEKRIRKGFTVSLRLLKPFDCEESDKFVDMAKEKFRDSIIWSLDLIRDYRIRIGCGSFVGSFIEYFTDGISYPVRRQCPQDSFELGFPSQQLLGEEQNSGGELAGEHEVEQNDQIDEVSSKKVLPDRAQAARNRANERLVDFIVRKRGVENRLMAVISGQESSKWLQALQSCRRSVVEVYLEDEKQVDEVYRYLENLCKAAAKTNTSLANTDCIRFILDVLLPEAIIHAIAGVDKLSLDKAEEKYRRGPCHSNRERQEFDMMIEQQMKLKPVPPRSSS